MVLSLVELSLRLITKGMENGTIQHPHLLPPKLRERVLETAIKQDLVSYLNVLKILTSVEFLDGMTSISADNKSHMLFLDRLTASLATKLPNGESIGAAITKLNLDIQERNYRPSMKDFYAEGLNRLIAQCPNTNTLALQVTSNNGPTLPGYWPLNENDAWIRVMENLVELSLCNWIQLGNMRPIITFDRLTTLKLDHCYLADNEWFELLENMPLVENLHLFNFRCIGQRQPRGLDWILPFPLAHLKWLEINGDRQIFECNNKFVDNLIGCPKLRQLHLMLNEKSTDEESLVRLANMEIDLKTKISLTVNGDDIAETAAILDSSSRFKLVRIFNEKIDYFELLTVKWDSRFLTALEDVLGTCSALTTFAINLPPTESEEDMKHINATLAQFFGTWERAVKLNDLRLAGKFDEVVVSAVFENCLNLAHLQIYRCLALRDQHMIDWVARGGGKLTNLSMYGCNVVTSEGIIPILARSAEGLSRCYVRLDEDNGGRNWMTELRILCPNAPF